MKRDTSTQRALRAGRSRAARVVAARSSAGKRRARAVKTVSKELAKKGQPTVTLMAAPAPSQGVLVAEGDSWFDYPWTDILEILEDDYAYDVESVAQRGDRVEDMAYSDGQLTKFARTVERVLRRGTRPRAILLSGGGNDIAGDEFAVLLNHALSPAPGLNDAVVTGIIDDRLRYSFVTILSAVTKVCVSLTGSTVPILVHGYDYAVPDGRGFMGGWGPLPGPWLEPGFRQKSYADMKVRLGIVRALIDRFNAMLQSVTSLPDFAHVRRVELRRTLSSGAGYKDWWANEMHPTPEGFRAVARKFADAIASS